MSLDAIGRAIGRMLMVGVRGAGAGDGALEADLRACAEAGVGGVILFDVDQTERARLEREGVGRDEAARRATRNVVSSEQLRGLTVTLRDRLGDDLLIAVDQEGGAVQRLSRARGFASTPGARDLAPAGPGAVREAGRLQAEQLARHGINVNFAPCVDLAINPASRIIAGLGRAFSDDPEVVAVCASAWIESHTRAGVASCLKHYPGHGSSAEDSHLGFVDITQTAQREEEEAPYRAVLSRFPGAPLMIMTGHLLDRTVDPDLPASLSPRHVRRLREGLGFDGVVIVDSLDMQAVTGRWGPAEAVALAANAGADIVLDAVNAPGPRRECPAPEMHAAITRAFAQGRIDGGAARLERSAARIDALVRRLAAPRGAG